MVWMNSESLISKLRITNICISYITDPLIKANVFFSTLILDANYCDIFNLKIIAIRVIFCQRSIQKIKMCLHNCLTSAVSCQCLCFFFFFFSSWSVGGTMETYTRCICSAFDVASVEYGVLSCLHAPSLSAWHPLVHYTTTTSLQKQC